MKRIQVLPRDSWVAEAQSVAPYFDPAASSWKEDTYYEFSQYEVEQISDAANELQGMFLEAVQYVIDRNYFPLLGIDGGIADLITSSWNRDEPSILGRFDFIYDKSGPHLLEYNTDGVGGLFEASVLQGQWCDSSSPGTLQFNNIEESLFDRFGSLLVGLRKPQSLYTTTATPMAEREILVKYIADVASRAGFISNFIPIQDIGWDISNRVFLDLDNNVMDRVYKIYPWEWMMEDDFGANITKSDSLWLEPAWKMLLGHKGLLTVLWDMYPFHPNLLPSSMNPLDVETLVRKPLVGREGANVRITTGSVVVEETHGDFEHQYMYQEFSAPPTFDVWKPNVGAWMVNDSCVGISVRESQNLILGEEARMVPHVIVG